jgi:hypothetical protein
LFNVGDLVNGVNSTGTKDDPIFIHGHMRVQMAFPITRLLLKMGGASSGPALITVVERLKGQVKI